MQYALDKQVQPSFNKQPYQAPSLRVYRDIQILTQAISNSMGNSDGVSGNNKTI